MMEIIYASAMQCDATPPALDYRNVKRQRSQRSVRSSKFQGMKQSMPMRCPERQRCDDNASGYKTKDYLETRERRVSLAQKQYNKNRRLFAL